MIAQKIFQAEAGKTEAVPANGGAATFPVNPSTPWQLSPGVALEDFLS
jgi:hypothetical protein